jgi:hypothetical protein
VHPAKGPASRQGRWQFRLHAKWPQSPRPPSAQPLTLPCATLLAARWRLFVPSLEHGRHACSNARESATPWHRLPEQNSNVSSNASGSATPVHRLPEASRQGDGGSVSACRAPLTTVACPRSRLCHVLAPCAVGGSAGTVVRVRTLCVVRVLHSSARAFADRPYSIAQAATEAGPASAGVPGATQKPPAQDARCQRHYKKLSRALGQCASSHFSFSCSTCMTLSWARYPCDSCGSSTSRVTQPWPCSAEYMRSDCSGKVPASAGNYWHAVQRGRAGMHMARSAARPGRAGMLAAA